MIPSTMAHVEPGAFPCDEVVVVTHEDTIGLNIEAAEQVWRRLAMAQGYRVAVGDLVVRQQDGPVPCGCSGRWWSITGTAMSQALPPPN